MGGAVSSGRDNNELIDNLMGGSYIRTPGVERVFRLLDRADYMTHDSRDQAYKDLAWRSGPLHLSAPCIYSEVMEGLELKPGLSFLNIGSGTGYLSTLAGLILGSSGISHGVEILQSVVDYANRKLGQFMGNSCVLDELDFCEPRFYCGNALRLAPLPVGYDRVYCGAACPDQYQNYFKQLIKVGGILVMPLNDSLVQIRRVSSDEWSTRSLLNVSFATLRLPDSDDSSELLRLEEQTPVRLNFLCRSAIREAMRGAMRRRHPELRESPPPRDPPAKRQCPRRICIPVDEDSDGDILNGLHDLDRAGGGAEMNALLSLVLNMGTNRAAGSLRVDSLMGSDSDTDDDDGDGNGDAVAERARPPGSNRAGSRGGSDAEDPENGADAARAANRGRSVIVFSFQGHSDREQGNSDRDHSEGEAGNGDSDSDRSGGGRDQAANGHNDGDQAFNGHSDRGKAVNGDIDGENSVNGHSDRNQKEGGQAANRRSDRIRSNRDRKEFDRDQEVNVRALRRSNRNKINGDSNSKNTGTSVTGHKDRDRSSTRPKQNPTATTSKGTQKKQDKSKSSTSKHAQKKQKISKSKKSKHVQDNDKEPIASSSSHGQDDKQEDADKNKKSKKTSSKKPNNKTDSTSTNGKDRPNKKSSKRDDKSDSDPPVPSEVEIYLGKSQPGSSAMDWEDDEELEPGSGEDEKRHHSSDEEASRKSKRRTGDSGLGEERSPSASASASTFASTSASTRSYTPTSDGSSEGRPLTEKRPLLDKGLPQGFPQRSVLGLPHPSASRDPQQVVGPPTPLFPAMRRRRSKRRRHATHSPSSAGSSRRGDGARRVFLSTVMKRGIKELPLPYQLKRFVNYYRIFQF